MNSTEVSLMLIVGGRYFDGRLTATLTDFVLSQTSLLVTSISHSGVCGMEDPALFLPRRI